MALGACVVPMALMLIGLCFPTVADFAQWDNLEVYLPWILTAHRRLLQGEFPLWNQHQNLGEPLHAMGPGGALYLPYTACTWLVDALGWDPRSLMSLIAVTHVGFAGLGLYRLSRSFGVRPLFAMIAGISGAMSGFGLMVGGVWIHVLPILAWSVWAICGTKDLIDFHRPARAALVATLSLAMAFAVGHIQAALYLWVVTGLFAIAYAAQRKVLAARIPWLAAVGLAAALLSMPSVLPTAALLPDSDRGQALPAREFSQRGLSQRALLGLLLPVYGGADGFLELNSLSGTHAGAWLVPTLIAACGVWVLGRRRRDGEGRGANRDGNLADGLALNGAMAVVVIALSLGDSAPFYGWTHGIPAWSSFRWPFKLFQHALPFAMVGGAIGLEMLARRPSAGSTRFFFLAMAMAALLLWIAMPGRGTPSALATGVCGLLTIALLACLDAPWGRALLVIMVALEALGMMLLTHRPERFKTYAHEKVGSFGPHELGITTDSRLLPVSPSLDGEVMQELGLFHSATLDNYYSLTGHRMALTSQRLWTCLPTQADGLLPRPLVPIFLQSNLMRSYNTRYVLAAKSDTAMVRFLRQLSGYRTIAETPRALVFANQDALPRFYFATEVHALEGAMFKESLIENRRPVTCALVTGARPREGPMPRGHVRRWSWGENRVAAEVEAPEGGFLVVSMSYSPDWGATVDGRRAELRITNGAIMGLEVPPGGTRVVLRYDPPSFRRGLWLALLGVVVSTVTVIALLLRGRKRSTPAGGT
jgi:hypothetical protein